MKAFKIRFATSALAVAALTALFFSSCQKEEILPPPSEVFSKEVALTDREGKNEVLVRISSAEAALLDARDWSEALSIEPVFETPAGEFSEPSEQERLESGLPEINFEIISEKLEAGAKGVNLHFVSEEGVGSRWAYETNFITTKDNIRVRVNYNCHDVHYYRKIYSYSPWQLRASFYNRCTPNSYTQYSGPGTYQVRAQVLYNSNTSFTVTTW